MTHSELLAQLTEALTGLPPTSGAVADYLVDLGVRGIPESECACPVARWLRDLLDVPAVRVDSDYIVVWALSEDVRTPTPKVVKDFMTIFDQGDFPDLIDERGPTPEEDYVNRNPD